MDETYDSVKLIYTIHKFSSYYAYYMPENILINNPTDQLSRWFTENVTPPQFIILKLKTPAIVETIKFGKYIKSHAGNLKKFQVLGGTDEKNLSVLLSAGLKNDSIPEVFRLRHRTKEGLYLPIKYIKIVPLQSWSPAHNYTIWYVELSGKNQPDLIKPAVETINLRKEEESIRLLLKHLRRRRYKDAYEALSRETGVQLEGPLQARLWNALVENGDFKLAEQIFEEGVAEGEIDWYLSWQPYTPEWRQMSGCSAQVETRHWSVLDGAPSHSDLDLHSADRDLRSDTSGPAPYVESPEWCEAACGPAGCCARPGPRGGHQLVVDSDTGTLYLFGGWNGTADLDDLWSFSPAEEKWSLLCRHSHQVGGPSPRSCHKMVFDPRHRRLYTLGRYLDNVQRIPNNMNSDLYMYDVSAGEWSVVCEDTAGAGGPRLVFDHQMCIDADTQTIYVFGGRVLPVNTEEPVSPQYSGLYAYHIESQTWQLLLDDKHSLPAPQPRVSHSMLFHPVQRRLYILAGQRNKEHLAELWWWDCARGRGRALCAAACAPPPQGFTQRATLDPDTDEMFVLSGMSKEKDKRVFNTLWVFSLKRLTWTCVYRNDSIEPDEPRPRFAHQLVYDPVRKVHYLFGGNPGSAANPRLRLDDLWALRLRRADAAGVVRAARAALRVAQYRALCVASPARALSYLRADVAAALDAADPQQVAQFHRLPAELFSGGVDPDVEPVCLSPARTRVLARRRAQAHAATDLTHALKQVLGAEEMSPQPPTPFEERGEEAEAPAWAAAREGRSSPPPAWSARAARLCLFDELSRYFRPSAVHPPDDLDDLVSL